MVWGTHDAQNTGSDDQKNICDCFDTRFNSNAHERIKLMDQLESLELKISKFLRIGVFVAGFLMLIGWLAQLFYNGQSFDRFKIYQAASLDKTLKMAVANNSFFELIAYLGLIILISLPITRVLLTALLFLKQKEYLLAGIASFVLIALIISFSLGIEL